jgi:hypothetical protein
VQRNGKFGPFWLPVSNASSSDAFLFGPTEVTIDYSDYEIGEGGTTAGSVQQSPKPDAVPRKASISQSP